MAINNGRIRFLRSSTKGSYPIYAGQPFFVKNGDSNIDGTLFVSPNDNTTSNKLKGINVATIDKGIYSGNTYMPTSALLRDNIYVNNSWSANHTEKKLKITGYTNGYNGSVDVDLSSYYVDRTTEQTISGNKTFNNNTEVKANLKVLDANFAQQSFENEGNKTVLTGLRSIYTSTSDIDLNNLISIGSTHIYPLKSDVNLGNGSLYFKDIYINGIIQSGSGKSKDITDITDAVNTETATAITLNTVKNSSNEDVKTDKLITNNAVYYALPKINDVKTYTSESTFYAPTEAGTKGSVLLSNGADVTPTWSTVDSFGDLTALRVNLQAAAASDTYNLIFSKDPTNNSLQYSSGVAITYNPGTGTLTTTNFKGLASESSKTTNALTFQSSATATDTFNGSAAKTLVGKVVDMFTAQTIAGVKTFSSAPKTSVTLAASLNDGTLATTKWVRTTGNGVIHSDQAETLTGLKTFTGGLVVECSANDDVTYENQDQKYLIVGKLDGKHLTFDNNEIIAKSNATTGGDLYLNTQGKGVVGIGGVASFDSTKGIVPDATGTFNLGTSDRKFKDAYFSGNIYGTLSGNASTATTLKTARTINGTSFNGSANITTAKWGTARNISITDGTNTSTAVSVDGSGAITLNLPTNIKGTKIYIGNDWNISASGTNLYINYGTTKCAKLLSTGELQILKINVVPSIS